MYKIPKVKVKVTISNKSSELFQITCSKHAAEILRHLFNQDEVLWREEMLLLLLNRANKVIGYKSISDGGIAGTVCDPKVVFTTALNGTASSIILAHNHPSGNLKPSRADEEITNKIKEGCKLLDMTLMDHIIITDDGYYSFADEGHI